MVRRAIPPFVRETLERIAVGLWFVGILALLYMTLRSQLAQGTEPQQDWDLVALCGGTVDVGDGDYGLVGAAAERGPAP